ncbi:hypothetical protein C0J52_22142 [Blattella germanica]|nr:hypothetical protein C0J52_22142 [Blattella germanica]
MSSEENGAKKLLTKKRKNYGRLKDVGKKLKLQSHETGPPCDCQLGNTYSILQSKAVVDRMGFPYLVRGHRSHVIDGECELKSWTHALCDQIQHWRSPLTRESLTRNHTQAITDKLEVTYNYCRLSTPVREKHQRFVPYLKQIKRSLNKDDNENVGRQNVESECLLCTHEVEKEEMEATLLNPRPACSIDTINFASVLIQKEKLYIIFYLVLWWKIETPGIGWSQLREKTREVTMMIKLRNPKMKNVCERKKEKGNILVVVGQWKNLILFAVGAMVKCRPFPQKQLAEYLETLDIVFSINALPFLGLLEYRYVLRHVFEVSEYRLSARNKVMILGEKKDYIREEIEIIPQDMLKKVMNNIRARAEIWPRSNGARPNNIKGLRRKYSCKLLNYASCYYFSQNFNLQQKNKHFNMFPNKNKKEMM